MRVTSAHIWALICSLITGTFAAPYGSIDPTTCNGAVWTLPSSIIGGTYNISIFDPCSKTTHSAFVDVICPQRIPADKFTVAYTQGGSAAAVVLTASVCDPGVTLTYVWSCTRRPSATSPLSDFDTSGPVLTKTLPAGEHGIFQFRLEVSDGCNLYTYDVALHWDNQQVRLVPPGKNFLEAANCEYDRPLITFVESGDEGFRNTLGWNFRKNGANSGNFGSTTVRTKATIHASEAQRAPTRPITGWSWDFTPMGDQFVLKTLRTTSPEWIVTARSLLTAEEISWFTTGAIDSGIVKPTSEDWASATVTAMISAYNPRNRANATFNTEAVSKNAKATLWRSTTTTTNVTGTYVYQIIENDPYWTASTLRGAALPTCKVKIQPGTDKPSEATVSVTPGPNTHPTFCVGLYNVSVTATTKGVCATTAYRPVHATCGFPPDVRLHSDNKRALPVGYDGISSAAAISLKVIHSDPFSRSLTRTITVTTPEGLTTTFGPTLVGTAETTIAFNAPTPGLYTFNFTISNGCSSTSVIETVLVYCASALLPTGVELAELASPTVTFTGTPFSAITLTLSNLGSTEAPSAPLFTTASFTGPAYVTGKSTMSATSGGAQFTPYGAGTYTLTVGRSQGCGQMMNRSRTLTVECGTYDKFDVLAHTIEVDALSKEATVQYQRNPANVWTRGAATTATFKHAFLPKTKNGIAVPDADRQVYEVKSSSNVDFSDFPTWMTSLPLPLGSYTYDYYVSDGCTEKSAVLTIKVRCPVTDVNIVGLETTYAGGQAYSFVANVTSGHETIYLGGPNYKFTFTKPDGSIQEVKSKTANVKLDQAGTWSVVLFFQNRCGYNTTTAAQTFTVTCPAFAPALEMHMHDGGKEAVTSVTYSSGRWPSVSINVSTSTYNLTNAAIALTSVYVTSAPRLSMYYMPDSEIRGPLLKEPFSLKSGHPVVPYMEAFDTRSKTEVTTETYRWQLDVSTTPTADFFPDVAGEYTLVATVVAPCGLPRTQTFTLTAACPAGETVAKIHDAKDQVLATSTGFAAGSIPGVGVTLTPAGNELLVLNASQSTVSGKSTGLFYHWYWETATSDTGGSSQYAYDHTGITTPFSQTLWLDAKLYPFNNRVLKLVVSDGCSSTVTGVRVNSVCSGANLGIQTSTRQVVIAPAETPNCGRTVKVMVPSGTCVKNTWTVSPIVSTTQGQHLTAADTFYSAFSVSTDSSEGSSTDKALLGVGIAIIGVALIVVAVLAWKYNWCGKKDKNAVLHT